MAITKQKKATQIESMTELLKHAAAAAIVSFSRLTVAEAAELRAELRKEQVKFTVIKKTLLERAFAAASVTGDTPAMPGEIAIAIVPKSDGVDVTAPARGVHAFVKKFKDKLSLVGGIIEGSFLSEQDTKSVATIPPTPILRGMFVNVINSPIQRFAIALGEVIKIK